MKTIFSALVFVSMAVMVCFGSSNPDLSKPLVLDDFDDAYGDPPNRNCLGAIKSYYENGNGYTGDYGYWYTFCDHGFIAKANGDTLKSDSMKLMCESNIMHVQMKLEPQSGSIYPGVEIGCSFFKDDVDTVNLSKMTAIVFKAKGSGTIRIGIKSYNVLPDWGFCSDTVKLSAAWTVHNIPISRLKAAPYSDSVNVVTWEKSKKKTFGFQIKTEAQKSAELYRRVCADKRQPRVRTLSGIFKKYALG